MNETVTIPRVEYERLCAMEEELTDMRTALAVEARVASGARRTCAGICSRPARPKTSMIVWMV